MGHTDAYVWPGWMPAALHTPEPRYSNAVAVIWLEGEEIIVEGSHGSSLFVLHFIERG